MPLPTSTLRAANGGQSHPSLIQNVEIANEGSAARDHSALERTYLAWLRTSLALVSFGIALTQFFRLKDLGSGKGGGAQRGDDASSLLFEAEAYTQDVGEYASRHRRPYIDSADFFATFSQPIGALFIVLGISTLGMGAWRYFTVQSALLRGAYVPSRFEVTTITVFLGSLLLIVLAVILASPSAGSNAVDSP